MKEPKIKSEGKCVFCEKNFAKAGINRHLSKHLADKISENKPGKSFLIKAEADPYYYGNSGFFLSLWVDGNATMKDIDSFLRAIWLECCGHLSSFTDPQKRRERGGGSMYDFFELEEMLEKGKTKEYEEEMWKIKGEIPMGKKVGEVFHKNYKTEYEYDFGSSTMLLLTAMEAYPIVADSPIVLLSRNEPLAIICGACGQEPAAEICTAHDYGENHLFCKKCAKKHAKTCADFDDYAAMPIVNSPRMGECAYTGGTIDEKRDGIFVAKT
ncbi:MAG: hypothetical protein QM642_08065 [Edaphocola sp.]